MDEEKLIQELVAQYGLKLKEHDPIFAGLFLNKIALQEYLSELENHLAESITNVAIKEDVTLRKLQKLFDEIQAKNRQETDRSLNQFADNLHARLHSLLNTEQNLSINNLSWPWLLLGICIGCIIGFMAGRC